MPVSVSYPGVYIQELSSGVRTITGVSTSIAAFLGTAARGPTDRAKLLTSFSEFEAIYGGLSVDSHLGYAVKQFFDNGGAQAYVVRLVGAGATAGTAAVPALSVKASSTGAWSGAYGLRFTKTASGDRFSVEVLRKQVGKALDDKNFPPRTVERFDALSMKQGDARYVRTILNTQSGVVVVDADPAADAAIPEGTFALAAGEPGAALAAGTAAFGAAVIASGSGYHLLETVDLFNILCVPGFSPAPETNVQLQELSKFCLDRRAMLLVDGKPDLNPADEVASFLADLPLAVSDNVALYYPWLRVPDPLNGNVPRDLPPSGFIAGLYARTDGTRGVWKAPAGTEAKLVGTLGVSKPMTDIQNGKINKLGINCIRDFAVYGTVSWGARTLSGNDDAPSDWKYVPVRRTALFLEESLFRALKWVVFEPNDEALWGQIRLNVGAFMHTLFRQGAFQGKSPQEAYFVKCDKETTTQNDINLGIVNIRVGFAPLKPAEFVVVQIQQIAGQIAV